MEIELFIDFEIGKLQDKVSGFIKGKNLTIHSANVTVSSCKDHYQDGRICNEWREYILTLIFSNPLPNPPKNT